MEQEGGVMDYALSIIIKNPHDEAPLKPTLYHGDDPLRITHKYDDQCTVGFMLDTYENKYGQYIAMRREEADDEALKEAVQLIFEMAMNVKNTLEKKG